MWQIDNMVGERRVGIAERERVGGRGGMVVREMSEGNFPWKGRDRPRIEE
jgi:hypothetical protein